MNNLNTLAAVAFALFLAAPAVSATAQNARGQNVEVNGGNVEMVIYTSAEKIAGVIAKASEGKWVEINRNGNTFSFDEIDRDEWSVYLRKTGRQAGQELQLDLYRQTISEFDSEASRVGFEHYKIAKSIGLRARDPRVDSPGVMQPEGIDGTNCGLVIFSRGKEVMGAFVQVTGKKWIDYSNDGGVAYNEDERDAWSIYLAGPDSSRVQIDLFTKSIKEEVSGQKHFDILMSAKR